MPPSLGSRRGSRPRLEELEDRLVLSPPGTGWQPLFADEFNGTALDTSAWTAHTGRRRDATNAANAVSVGGGNLTLTTYTQSGTHYTGFVGSSAGFRATYGYWEARINFQDAPGMWSAFWAQSPTMGNPVGNPFVAGTEIDIVEHRARDAAGTDISNKSVSNLHWDGYGADHRSVGSGLVNNPGTTPLQGNFHTYALQWGPAGYQFYIDGTQVWSTAQAVSGRSHFIYLTSEVQNASWAGSIPAGGYGSLAASTTKMVVDWVRVWQRPVSNVPDQALNEAAAAPVLPVTVTQRDGRTTTVTAASSNPDLLPAGSLTFGGSGANRTLTVRPAAGQTGMATVTVSANNGTVSGSDSFTVTVHAGSFRNAGFEEDAAGAGWGRYGGAQVTTTGARSGGRAMRIAGFGGAEQMVTGLRPNTTYTLSGYARVTLAGTPALIGVKNYGGAQRTATLSGTAYAPGTVTFTTGPTATEATVFVYKPTAVNDGYFDDLTLFAVANRAPVLAQPADRTVPNSQDIVTVALSATDPDGDALTYTAAAQSLAYVLDRQLGLFTDGNLYEDYGGRGDKWLLGAAGEWYFLLPSGELYRWDGGAGAAGALVGNVGASYHARLDLLYNAALAFDLDTQLGLFSDGNLYTNYGGLGEKWLLGSGGTWYFITPGGELYRWDGTPDRATGTLVAAPGASFHADPALLFNAAVNPHAALSVAGTTLTIDREDGFVGALVVTVTASDGLLTDSKTFHVFVTA